MKRASVPKPIHLPDFRKAISDAWRTNHRVTLFLIKNLPAELWDLKVPGEPRRSVRTMAAHLHNTRCAWIKTLGREHGVAVPASVSRHKVKPEELARALESSGEGISSLLKIGFERGGSIPASAAYVWRNLPLDVGHVLAYFVAHEAHHRGQMVLIARQLGHRLPAEVTNGIWQWTKLSREAAVLASTNQKPKLTQRTLRKSADAAEKI